MALLREDHAALEALFCEFENGPRHDAVRRSIVDRILESLTRHVEVEEDTIYPWAQTVLPDRDADHLASLEEHRLMVALIEDLRTLAPDHERFDARGRVLIELTRHHMWEEEASMFQDAVDAVDDDAQHDLARAVRRAHRRTG